MFPLWILRCKTHQIGFTLYPPGHFPYGRKPLAPVGPDGFLLTQTDGVEHFHGTYFEAAIDASKGRLWPSESLIGSGQPRYQTQKRHIDRALLLLGLDPGLDDKQREAIAHLLIIPGQSIHDGTKRLIEQSSSRIKGAVVCDILNQITPTAFIFERLVDAGSVVELWPTSFIWDSNLHHLLPVSFRTTGIRASPV